MKIETSIITTRYEPIYYSLSPNQSAEETARKRRFAEHAEARKALPAWTGGLEGLIRLGLQALDEDRPLVPDFCRLDGDEVRTIDVLQAGFPGQADPNLAAKCGFFLGATWSQLGISIAGQLTIKGLL